MSSTPFGGYAVAAGAVGALVPLPSVGCIGFIGDLHPRTRKGLSVSFLVLDLHQMHAHVFFFFEARISKQ